MFSVKVNWNGHFSSSLFLSGKEQFKLGFLKRLHFLEVIKIELLSICMFRREYFWRSIYWNDMQIYIDEVWYSTCYLYSCFLFKNDKLMRT